MAARRGTSDTGRVEPNLGDGGGRQAGTLDLRLEPGDRVPGGGRKSAPAAAAKRSGRSGPQRIEPGFGGGASGGGLRAEREPAGGGSGGRGGGSPPRPRRSFVGRFVRGLFSLAFILGIWGVIAVGGIIAYQYSQLPPASEWAVPKRPPNVKIVSEQGDLIANRGELGGEELTLAQMSPWIPKAVIAIEDRRFYSHFGVDPVGLVRAMATNFRSGSVVQGGSTLTQQLAKNLFLEPQRTMSRKIQEVLLALWLERTYTKDQILEMYLNRVYLGSGAHGVDAASRRYFGVSAKDVTLPQAALLAGLLKAPSRYAPTRSRTAAEERAGVVLTAMRDQGVITDKAYQAVYGKPIPLAPEKGGATGNYVADWVMDLVPGYVGQINDDLVVETTVDMGIQTMAEEELRKSLDAEGKKYGVSQGAVVVMDGAGAVKALVGGRDYRQSQFNRAVAAKRQPGSSFKPFVYLTALEAGMTPDTVRVDQPVTIKGWSPENYTRKYLGAVTLKKALALSLNTVAAQVGNEVGPQNVVNTAHRLGIRSDLSPNPSIALGTSEVTLLEMTSAFVPFSNGGIGVVPNIIRRIKSDDGQLLYERKGTGPGRVVSDANIGALNFMLSEVLISGTGQRAQIKGWPAAGKTGTSQDYRDGWFVGYTAFFTAGVWMGNDDGTPTKKAGGGTLPAATWGRLMTRVHNGMMVADLPDARPAPTIGSLIAANAELPEDGPSATPAPGAPGSPVPLVGPGAVQAPPPAQKKGDGIGGFLKGLFGG